MEKLTAVKALTFDLFGTVLDLSGSLTPFIARFLEAKGARVAPARFWEQWRYRQRLEQYQDNIMMLGHSGYLETARRAFVYVLALNQIQATKEEVKKFMPALAGAFSFSGGRSRPGKTQNSLQARGPLQRRASISRSFGQKSNPLEFR